MSYKQTILTKDKTLQRKPHKNNGVALKDNRNLQKQSINNAGVVQRMLLVNGQNISSGMIINSSQRSQEYNAAMQNYPIDQRLQLQERIRQMTLSNDRDSFASWPHLLERLTTGVAHRQFRTGQPAAVAFTDQGELAAPGEARKASGYERSAEFEKIGVGQHVLAGHFKNEVAMRGDAGAGRPNFRFENDKALATVVELGRGAFQDGLGGQMRQVQSGKPLGHGFVRGTDGQLYKVGPKNYRVIKRHEGDFRTAYGVTEETNPANFHQAYHSWEQA